MNTYQITYQQITLQSLVKSMPVGHCLSWGCHNCVDCRIKLTFDPVTHATTRHLCTYHRCVCSSSTWAEFPARAAAGWRRRSPRWGRCSPAPEPASPCPGAWWSPPGATERSEGMWWSLRMWILITPVITIELPSIHTEVRGQIQLLKRW